MGARLQGRRASAARADARERTWSVALWLTRGRHKTFPLLQLDGEAIGDSTAIIAALERRFPDPPLYPEDPAERSRALELEEFFDEELGPHLRLLAFHEATKDPASVERFTVDLLPGRLAEVGPVRAGATRFFSTFTGLRYGVKSDRTGGAREDQGTGGARSARCRAGRGRLPRRRPLHRRRPDGRVAVLPAGAAAGGAGSAAATRGDGATSAPRSRTAPATSGSGRCSGDTGTATSRSALATKSR